MYIFEKAFAIATAVTNGIEGRAADGGTSLPYLASMAINAGPGDHCEVGTLFGASAITVAVAKKEWGFPGKVYCVDPYLPRKDTVQGSERIPPGLLDGNPDVLARNAVKFGVEDRIVLIHAPSQPWAPPLMESRFVSAYIDGNHLAQYPWWDFVELSRRTEHYIAFDNYEESYPDVINAVLRAVNGKDWQLYFKNSSFVALRKTMNRPDRMLLDPERV